ncbi:MAG: carbohydrate-binding domain-containing protein [Clostridia bacterium]|nr:carbohydrate-binding domain-containing protein [Clostridia bacterium]
MIDEKKSKNQKIIIGVFFAIFIIAVVVGFVLAFSNKNNTNENSSTGSQTTASATSKNNTSSSTTSSTTVDSTKNLSITNGGSYDLSGSYESITINTSKEVTLNLSDVEISNSNGPAINVEAAKSVIIVLNGNNKITVTTTEDLDGAIYSKDDLVLSGSGSLEISSNYHGIAANDTLVINGGSYVINSEKDGINANDVITINDGNITITNEEDGIHCDGLLEINGGTFNITAAEGLEATYVKINNGTINISATDDGINAANKSTDYEVTVEINGGNITIKMGQGDTDAIDSNGNLYVNGGTINITANSPFDYDGKAEKNGGTIIVNGTEIDSITNQFGGEMNGGMNGGQMMPNENMNNGGQMNPENMRNNRGQMRNMNQ